jgi:hypothetical protein
MNDETWNSGVIPLLVRRGGCGTKKISAKPTLNAADGVVAHDVILWNAF